MGRFTAWMASRRRANRTANAAARGRRNARPLSFERCEQRIALSANAAVEGGYAEPGMRYFFSQPPEGIFEDGGAVTVEAYGVFDSWHLLNKSNSAFLFMGDVTPTGAASRMEFDLSSNLDWMSFSGAPAAGVVPAMAGDSGVFITDSLIVPIPPPALEPGGGNEGGAIAMTPFIAPSMLGLPGGGQSQLAAETRQSLTAEQLESAQAAGATQQDSLRGRAVVYEVAHAQPLNADRTNVASVRTKLGSSAKEAASTGKFEFVEDNARARPVMYDASAATRAPSSHVPRPTDRAAVEAEHGAPPIVDDAVVVQRDGQTSQPGEESAVAAAYDAAIEEFGDEFGPIDEHREVAAATVDMHGKRVLGGALIAVAAIPVAKVVRRQSQRSFENRPRRDSI